MAQQNINKGRNWKMPLAQGRTRASLSARDEIKDPMFQDGARSFMDETQTTAEAGSRGGRQAVDGALYSFDRLETPGRPVSLEVFVKATGRETEQLVQKEYEILDETGEAVKGRRARRALRQAARPAEKATAPDDDLEGCEVV